MKKTLWAFLFFIVFLPMGSFAQNEPVPVSREQITMSFAPVVKTVTPAVVNIYTRKLVQQRVFSPFLDDPFFQRFFGNLQQGGVTRQRLERSLGSGVIVRPDGLVATCNHVIAGADQITVVLSDRREFEATLLTSDDKADLAILRIDPKGEKLPSLDLRDSDTAEVGDLVLAVGNPFGVGQTVTSGIISALARTTLDINDINYFIQTDAAINPGNSGGALVTMDGKLVGLNSAIYSRSGGNNGIGFAIPSNMVKAALRAVQAGQKNIVRPWTGIEGQAVTSELASSLGMPKPYGLLVNQIHPASPAKQAGLKVGDVITALDGKTVEDPAAFRYRVATLALDTPVEMEILRAGQKLTISLKLMAPPEVPARNETHIKGRNPLAGIVIANLSPAVSEEMGVHGSDKGVVIRSFQTGSYATRIGLQVGDVLAQINGKNMDSVKDVLTALSVNDGKGWRISIRRGEETLTIFLTN